MQKKDLYNLDDLQKKLGLIGYDLRYFPQSKSTMLAIDKLAKNPPTERIPVVITDHQAHGIGRKDRLWYDIPYRSVMFSALFHIRESNIATFADLVALEVCSAVRKSTSETSVKIKYPNDLVINDKKVGGVLVKNIYDKNFNYKGTNVGVGINAHYTEDDLKRFSTDYPATSLDLVTDSSVKRQDILVEILSSLRYLDTEADAITNNQYARDKFEKRWQQAASLLGKNVEILKQNKPEYSGKVVNTKLGEGIEIQTEKEKVWISLFESDMKVRIKNYD